MKQGKFIVFEGLDGSGKTTQLERLGALTDGKVGYKRRLLYPGAGRQCPGDTVSTVQPKKAGLGAGDGSAAVCR